MLNKMSLFKLLHVGRLLKSWRSNFLSYRTAGKTACG